MFFALTDEQRALETTVRDYLADRFGPDRVREQLDDPDGDGHPAELWKALGEQGWLAVLVPEQHDGLGLGLLDAAVVSRRLGAATTPGPWLPTVLAGEALRLAGSPEQQATWLPRLAAGETPLTVALTDGSGGVGTDAVPLRSDAGRLTGSAPAVEYAHVAERVVVAALDADGAVGLHLLDPAGPGVSVRRYRSLDRTTRLAELSVDGAVGEPLPGATPDVLDDLLRRGAVLTAADLVGAARHALTATVAYDKDRVQFGRPVGSFQVIKHDLADLHVAVTMAEHGVLYAAHALDTARPDATLMTSVAKAKASDTARDATALMIQYHGGIGYTWEHDTHLYFKRVQRQAHAYGDAATHRELVARLVVDPLTAD